MVERRSMEEMRRQKKDKRESRKEEEEEIECEINKFKSKFNQK